VAINQVLHKAAGNPDPEQLRHELQESGEPEIVLRRAVIGASVAGIAAKTAVTFFQSGIVKHLPDPPEQDFDSEKVNSSTEAYSYGTPDGPLAITNHAVNLVFATSGSANRAQEAPWLPVMATLAAAPAALSPCSIFSMRCR
jgi:hypothetical protein